MRSDNVVWKFNTALFLRAILLLSPVMLLFYLENGLSVKDFLFFQGIFYFASILFDIPIGYFSNNHSKRKLLICSFMIFFVIIMLWLTFRGYYVILLGEILFAISKDIMDNATSSYLYDYLEHKNMPRHYGYLNFYLALGTAIAAILGTFLYSKYNSELLLIVEAVLISVSIFLISSLPDIKPTEHRRLSFKSKISEFIIHTKNIYLNPLVKYYILYSGFLTSFSLLFATSFQPIMQGGLFPIVLFGAVAFINHFTRALAGIIAGKWLFGMDIKKMIIPLYILYLIAFACIFLAIHIKNFMLSFAFLIVICIIIGCQLIFTILHISRIHKFVSLKWRGSLMSINNCTTKLFAAVLLISSRFFTYNTNLDLYFAITFCIFTIFGGYLCAKTYNIKNA